MEAGGSAAAHPDDTENHGTSVKFNNKEHSLPDFMDRIRRDAESCGGTTMIKIAFGDLGSIDTSSVTETECQEYLMHLVNWQRQRPPHGTFESYQSEEQGEGDEYIWKERVSATGKQYLASMVEHWNYKYFKDMCDATRGFESYSVVLNQEKIPIATRVKAAWNGLRSAYDQVPPYLMNMAKRNVTEVLLFETTAMDKDGRPARRTWHSEDDMVLTFNTYDQICDRYNRLCRKADEAETTQQPECTDDQRVERFKILLDPHELGYEVTLDKFDRLDDDAKTWYKFKDLIVAKYERIKLSRKASSAKPTFSMYAAGDFAANRGGPHSRDGDCNFWIHSGNCKFGDKCIFQHLPHKKGTGGGGGGGGGGDGRHKPTTVEGHEVCFNFQNSGNCKFGQRCNRIHVDSNGKVIQRPSNKRKGGGGNGGGKGGGGKGGGGKDGGERLSKGWTNQPDAKRHMQNKMKIFIASVKEANPGISDDIEFPAFPTVVYSAKGKSWAWSSNTVGLDSDAQASITMYDDYFVDIWTCAPVEMVGLSGAKVTIDKQGLRLLPAKLSDGSTILIPDTCYISANCQANVVSMQELHRSGFDLNMGYEGRSNKSTTTNSPHALMTPDPDKVVWASISGTHAREGKGIVTLNLLTKRPEDCRMPSDWRAKMKDGAIIKCYSKRESVGVPNTIKLSDACNTRNLDQAATTGSTYAATVTDETVAISLATDFLTKECSFTQDEARAIVQDTKPREDGKYDHGDLLREDAVDFLNLTCHCSRMEALEVMRATVPLPCGRYKYDALIDAHDGVNEHEGVFALHEQEPSVGAGGDAAHGEDDALKNKLWREATTTQLCTVMAIHELPAVIHQCLFAYHKLNTAQRSRLWQRRLAYADHDKIRMMAKDKAIGIDFNAKAIATDDDPIASFARFKTKPYHSSKTDHSGLAKGHTVSIDHLSGFKVKTTHGAQSCYVAICYATNYVWCVLVKGRDDFGAVLNTVASTIAAQGGRLRRLRADSAPEIIAGDGAKQAAILGITIEPVGTYSPASGGKHEKAIQHLCHKTRACLLLACWLPANCWGPAIQWACTLVNITPTKLNGSNVSPYERWYEHPPNMKKLNIHTFGAPCTFGLTKAQRMATPAGKMSALTVSAFFLGRSGHMALLLHDGRVITGAFNRIEFYEGVFCARNPPTSPTPLYVDTGEQVVTDARANKDANGLDTIQSEQTLRPPNPVYNQIAADLANATMNGSIKLFNGSFNGTNPSDDGVGSAQSSDFPAAVVPAQGQATTEVASDPTSSPTVTEHTERLKSKDQTNLAYKLKCDKYNARYGGHAIPVAGTKKSALVIKGTAGYNHDNKDYGLFKDGFKAFGFTVKYHDGEKLWQPLFNGDQGIARLLNHIPVPQVTVQGDKVSANRTSPRLHAANVLTMVMQGYVAELATHSLDCAKTLRGLVAPKTVFDCITAPDWAGWHQCASKEMNSWWANNVFTTVKKCVRKPGTRTFPLSALFTRKFKSNGLFDKHKLRLCVLGNLFRKNSTEQPTPTFSPTISANACRLMLCIAASTANKLESLDIATAYLTAPNSGHYYCFRPNVFTFASMTKDDVIELRKKIEHATPGQLKVIKRQLNSKYDPDDNHVLSIERSVYGDPGAGRSYFDHFTEVLRKIGCYQCTTEPCFWTLSPAGMNHVKANGSNSSKRKRVPICTTTSKDTLYLITFVDDVLFCGPKYLRVLFVQKIKENFKIEHDPSPTSFLGLQLSQSSDNKEIEITLTNMIEELHARFKADLEGRPQRSIPAAPGTQLQPATDEEFEDAKHKPMQSLIGAMCFIICWCKCEASCAFSQLGSHAAKWNIVHYNHALDLLSYLYVTRRKGLMFRHADDGQNRLYGYADADLGNDSSGKSRSGKAIFFNYSPVVLKSNLQRTVSIATSASEMIALSDCAMEMQGLINLLLELKFPQNEPCTIYEDNTACKATMESDRNLPKKARHIALRELKCKELVQDDIIAVQYCATAHQIADLLSKNLPKVLFHRFADYVTGYRHPNDGILAYCMGLSELVAAAAYTEQL